MVDPFQVEPATVRRALARARAGGPDVVGTEVARRMLERFDLIRIDPARVIEILRGRALPFAPLAARFPSARVVPVAPGPVARVRAAGAAAPAPGLLGSLRRAAAALRSAAGSGQPGPTPASLAADPARLPFAASGADLVWSVFAIDFSADPAATLREWHRVLRPGGLVLFSAYGPDTLCELRAACAALGQPQRVHRFLDMHDLGDLLGAAGFADPVMESERLTITYDRLQALAADLRANGETCALAGRPRGLTTPRRWAAIAAGCEPFRREGRLPVTVEVTYGHAWKTAPRRAADGREVIRFVR